MTAAPDFLVVGEHTARNPVARAVAQARIGQAVRDFALRLYLLPDDTEVMADAANVPGVGERQARALGEFLQFLGQMRERFRAGHIAEPTEELVRVMGLEDAARHSVKDPVAAERKAEAAGAVDGFDLAAKKSLRGSVKSKPSAGFKL